MENKYYKMLSDAYIYEKDQLPGQMNIFDVGVMS